MIRTLALKGASALVAGMFCVGMVEPSPVLAQDRPATEMKAKTTQKAAKKATPSKAVMALQEALNKNGAKLAVDGRMGKMTRTALRNYQKSNGLKVTGMADKATKAKLGI